MLGPTSWSLHLQGSPPVSKSLSGQFDSAVLSPCDLSTATDGSSRRRRSANPSLVLSDILPGSCDVSTGDMSSDLPSLAAAAGGAPCSPAAATPPHPQVRIRRCSTCACMLTCQSWLRIPWPSQKPLGESTNRCRHLTFIIRSPDCSPRQHAARLPAAPIITAEAPAVLTVPSATRQPRLDGGPLLKAAAAYGDTPAWQLGMLGAAAGQDLADCLLESSGGLPLESLMQARVRSPRSGCLNLGENLGIGSLGQTDAPRPPPQAEDLVFANPLSPCGGASPAAAGAASRAAQEEQLDLSEGPGEQSLQVGQLLSGEDESPPLPAWLTARDRQDRLMALLRPAGTTPPDSAAEEAPPKPRTRSCFFAGAEPACDS